jgi:hypothetical protein
MENAREKKNKAAETPLIKGNEECPKTGMKKT